MIPALIAKDLNLLARDRSFHVALAVYLLVYLAAGFIFFSGFLFANPNSFAAMSSLLVFRITALLGCVLAALTPWLVLRMNEQDLGSELTPLGPAILAVPWKIMLSKVIASAICLWSLLILALPVLCLARLLGATTFRQIGWALTDTFVFLLVLTLLILHMKLQLRGWLSSWILSYAALGVLAIVWYRIWDSFGREPCSQIFMLLLVFFAALLFPHGNRVLSYERN
jgi:hypothetical protein